MERSSDLSSDLVFAVLAVQSKNLKWAFSLNDGLDREGLFHLEEVAKMSPEEVAIRLERAGFDRGDFFLGIFSRRLLELARAYPQLRSPLWELEQARDVHEIGKQLTAVWGVGPVVLRNYLILRGLAH